MTVYLEGGSACGKSRLGEEWAVFLHRGSPGPLLTEVHVYEFKVYSRVTGKKQGT